MSTTKPIKDKTDLEAIKNYYLDKKEYRNYTLIIIGLNTALRIIDILSLTWKDVYHYKKKQFHNHIYLTEKNRETYRNRPESIRHRGTENLTCLGLLSKRITPT